MNIKKSLKLSQIDIPSLIITQPSFCKVMLMCFATYSHKILIINPKTQRRISQKTKTYPI